MIFFSNTFKNNKQKNINKFNFDKAFSFHFKFIMLLNRFYIKLLSFTVTIILIILLALIERPNSTKDLMDEILNYKNVTFSNNQTSRTNVLIILGANDGKTIETFFDRLKDEENNN